MISPARPRRSIPPALGSQPSQTVNRRINSKPTQKTGMDWPMTAPVLPRRSHKESGRVAARFLVGPPGHRKDYGGGGQLQGSGQTTEEHLEGRPMVPAQGDTKLPGHNALVKQ